MGLQSIKSWIKNCVGCGMCTGPGPIYPFREEGMDPEEEGIPSHPCPMYERYRFISASPRGLLYLAAAIVNQEFTVTQRLVDRAYQCLTCGVCDDLCQINKTLAVQALREEMVGRGVGPLPANQQIDAYIAKNNNVFGLPAKLRGKWTEDLGLSTEGDFLFFAGCYDSYRYPKEARDFIRIFQKSGLKVAHLGVSEICCGAHAFWDGNTDLALTKGRALIGAIEKTKHKEVVVTCPDCYRVLAEDYANLLGGLPFKVTHVSVKLAEVIRNGGFSFTREINETATYHDPCRLFNHFLIEDEPREIIKSVPGLHYKELRDGKRWSACCGSGGMVVQHAFPEFTEEVAVKRLNRAKSLAPLVITNCPHCFETFVNVSVKFGIEVKIQSLVNLVAESMAF